MPRSYATSPRKPNVKAPRPKNSPPLPLLPGREYADGVKAACKRVAKDARLAVKMTSGNTLGETIAQQIERDLL